MKTSLVLVASIVLAASLSGCASTGGGYGGGAAYLDECEYGDCYGGPQYTCVIYEPVPAPLRMEIALAQRSHTTRTVGPRGEIGPAPSPSDSGSSFSPTSSAPAAPAVSRAPVVVASPSVDRGSPRVPN